MRRLFFVSLGLLLAALVVQDGALATALGAMALVVAGVAWFEAGTDSTRELAVIATLAAAAAAGRVLPRFPRLMSVAFDGALYRYRSVDIAFVARTRDGRLYTPVVRSADRADVHAVAAACQAATLNLMRGAVRADALEGACFTISHVPVGRTTRVAALPSFGQSAILGVSAERPSLELVDGAVVQQPIVTLTLGYDHALCDGIYAAGFLAELVADLEQSS